MTIKGPAEPDAGVAQWQMDIQEQNEPTSPQPAIGCGGQATLSETIDGVPGGGPNFEKGLDWRPSIHQSQHDRRGLDHARDVRLGHDWHPPAIRGSP
jgi:hypothetical protein